MARVSVSPEATGARQQPRRAASLQASGISGPQQLLLMVPPPTRMSTLPGGPVHAGEATATVKPLLHVCGVRHSTIPTCRLGQANDFEGTASVTNLGSVTQRRDVI